MTNNVLRLFNIFAITLSNFGVSILYIFTFDLDIRSDDPMQILSFLGLLVILAFFNYALLDMMVKE